MPALLSEAFRDPVMSTNYLSTLTRSALADIRSPFFTGYNSLSSDLNDANPVKQSDESSAQTQTRTDVDLTNTTAVESENDDIYNNHNCETMVYKILSCPHCRKKLREILNPVEAINARGEQQKVQQHQPFPIPISNIVIYTGLVATFILLLVDLVLRMVNR